jgi:hypothetical protein
VTGKRATPRHATLTAAEVVTEYDSLAICLQNASRIDPYSVSNKQLRRLLTRPEILDYLERLVFEDREREAEYV